MTHLNALLVALEGMTIFYIASNLIWGTEWDTWRDVLQTVAVGLALILVWHISYWVATSATNQVGSPDPIYVWGLRIIAILGLLRVIWPNKLWIKNESNPRRARLQFLGLVVVTGVLSFFPVT